MGPGPNKNSLCNGKIERHKEVYHCVANHNKGRQLNLFLINKQQNTITLRSEKMMLCTCLLETIFCFPEPKCSLQWKMYIASNNLSTHINEVTKV